MNKKDFIEIKVENHETYARLNFLRDLAEECYEEEKPEIKKWEDMRTDLKDAYLKEAKEAPDYILTLEEVKNISKLIEG